VRRRGFFIFFMSLWLVFTAVRDASCGHDCGEKWDKEWDPPSTGPLVTWDAPVCEGGKLEIQPYFFYNRTRGSFNDECHYKSFTNKETKSQFVEQLYLVYGLTDRLEISGLGTYQQNLRKFEGASAEASGFSDTYIYGRYCAVEETKWLPHATAFFQLKMPTGKYEKADEGKLGTDLMGATSGGGSYDHGYGAILTKRIKPFIFHCDFIYSFPIETRVDGVKTRYAPYINYDFGVEWFLPKGFNLLAEANGFRQGDRKADGEYVPGSDISYLTLGCGIGWSCDRIQALICYQRTVAGENTDVNDSFVATLVFGF
jgi:hypothetical protein